MANKQARIAYDALKDVERSGHLGLPLCTVESYDGHVDDSGVFHGTGSFTSCMGFSYEGCFAGGQVDHSGKVTWVNGYTVEGAFANGAPNGHATIIWPGGDRYEGSVMNGVRHGSGKLISHKGRAAYDGNWAHGKRDGYGVQQYPDGSLYAGHWAVDQQHGKGRYTYANGDCYDGMWRNGKRHGHGEMGWTRGTSQYVELYDGEWWEGVPHGSGSSTYIRLVGSSVVDTSGGPNAYAPPAGSVLNVYRGQYAGGLREGCGTFYYADGSSYDGEWVGGKKHGRGKFTSANGSSFYSVFDNDVARDKQQLQERDNVMAVPELYIRDLFGPVDGSERAAQANLQSLLIRFNTSLRLLFRSYANKSDEVALVSTHPTWWKRRLPGHISLPQLLRLFSDGGILNGTVTVASIVHLAVHVLVTEAQADEQRQLPGMAMDQTEALTGDFYCLRGTLNYRQFVEMIVRLAPIVCIGERFLTLCDQVKAIVTDYLHTFLRDVPVCPVSRAHSELLRPYLERLHSSFGDLVSLHQTTTRFLPARSLMIVLRDYLAKYGIDLGNAARALFPFSRRDDMPVPAGFIQPLSELGARIFCASCGADDELLLSSVLPYRELTLVDFVEAIVCAALMVNEGCGVGPAVVLDEIVCDVLCEPHYLALLQGPDTM